MREQLTALVQGMNFIAGALLLFMDEEVVFWALATIVEDLLPGYFAQDLVAAQVDQLVFKHMVRRRRCVRFRTFRGSRSIRLSEPVAVVDMQGD